MRKNRSPIFAFVGARFIAPACILLLAILTACDPFSGPGTTSPTGSPIIKVAVDLSVNDGAQNGAHLAVDQANANHTIPNITLQFVSDDPANGANNITTSINDALFAGIVGPLTSSLAQKEMPIANQAPLAIISPTNTNPCLTLRGSPVGCTGVNDLVLAVRPTAKVTYFRLLATDDHQGPVMADYLFKTAHLKKAFVIDDAETYGIGLARFFALEWKKLGGIVIDRKSHKESTTSYVNLLTAAAINHPDVIYYGGVSAPGATLIRKQMQIIPALKNTVFAGGDGIQNTSFAQAVGPMGAPIYATAAALDATKIPTAQTFVKDYTAKYGAVGLYSATAFDATNILIQAIKAALTKGTHTPTNSSDVAGARIFRQAVIDAIQAISYNGATGHTAFDQNGDTTNKTFTIYQVAYVGHGKPTWAPHVKVTL